MTTTVIEEVTLEGIRQFLYREARYLDDREFEKWLECYHSDAEFWMPAWADDEKLTRDPQRDLCGPPAMVEAVRGHIASLGVTPANFHYEKFTPAAVRQTAEAA